MKNLILVLVMLVAVKAQAIDYVGANANQKRALEMALGSMRCTFFRAKPLTDLAADLVNKSSIVMLSLYNEQPEFIVYVDMYDIPDMRHFLKISMDDQLRNVTKVVAEDWQDNVVNTGTVIDPVFEKTSKLYDQNTCY
jgi:hypothetical protein